MEKPDLKYPEWDLEEFPFRKFDEEGTRKLLREMGRKRKSNYIDSARGYTVSEQYIGYGLEGIRDKFILATKSMSRTKDAMAADIETSLKTSVQITLTFIRFIIQVWNSWIR